MQPAAAAGSAPVLKPAEPFMVQNGGVTASVWSDDPGVAGGTATLRLAPTTGDVPEGAVSEVATFAATDASGAALTRWPGAAALSGGLVDEPWSAELSAPGVEVAFAREALEVRDDALTTLQVWHRTTDDAEWAPVPSAWLPARGAVVAQADSTGDFVVAPSAPRAAPVVALDLDDDAARAMWDGEVVGELPTTAAVAELFEGYVEDACMADVLITRSAETAVVDPAMRAAAVTRTRPTLALTLGFDATDGLPGGTAETGGARVWSTDTALAAAMTDALVTYTGRPARTVDSTELGTARPVADAAQVADATYARVELGYLDHNYDHAVIAHRPELYAQALARAVVSTLDRSGECWPRPSAAAGTVVAGGHGFSRGTDAHVLPMAEGDEGSWWGGVNQRFEEVDEGGVTATYSVTAFPAEGEPGTVRVNASWDIDPHQDMLSRFWTAIREVGWWLDIVVASLGEGSGDFELYPAFSPVFSYDPATGNASSLGNISSWVSYRVDGDWDGHVYVLNSSDDPILAWTAPWAAPPLPPGPFLPLPPDRDVLALLAGYGLTYEQIYGGDPVNLATGNVTQSEELLALTGVGDQMIDLTLTYNGGDGRITPVGRGWNFAYSAWAQKYDGGGVLITGANGQGLYFTPDGGGYASPPAARATLAKTADGVVLTRIDGTQETYTIDPLTGTGVLTGVVDRQGNAYTLAYASRARGGEGAVFAPLASITDEGGQQVVVTTTSTGRITGFTRPDGAAWTLGYDGDNLTSITDAAGHTRSFAYDDAGYLTSITRADGVVEVTNAYDLDHRVAVQVDGRGLRRTFAYDGDGTTTLTDALGNSSTVVHDDAGLPERTIDAAGGVTRTEYDDARNPVTSVDALGNEHHSTFDATGRVLTTTDPLGNTTTSAYNAAGDLTSRTTTAPDGSNATTTFVLNEDGRAVETHLPDGTVMTAAYDAHGDVTSVTDAAGNTTRHSYDARGNRVQTVDAEGGTSTFEFDLANRLTASTDPTGARTVYTYDGDDNVVSVTDPIGAVTKHEYDATGTRTSTTDPLGNVTRFEHNANLQITAEIAPDGARTELAYDDEHHVTTRTNPDGTTVTFTYDALGRQVSITDEADATTTTEYDAVGNPVAVVDAEGGRTTSSFDALGQVTSVTDPLGHTTSTTWLPGGLVGQQTDAIGGVTARTYDVMGRLTGVTTPDAATTTYTYDPVGNIATITDPRGGVTAFAYDALGRQVSRTDATGAVWTTEYDGAGRIVTTTDPTGATTTNAYDAAGHLVATTDPTGGTTSTTYDAAGRVTASTDPLGRVTTLTYDEAGRVLTVTDPTGAVTTQAYDEAGRLAQLTDARGQVTTYGYDPTGRRTLMVDAAGGHWTTEYDRLGRALAETDPTGARTEYTYDAAGRRVEVTDPTGATTTTSYDTRGVAAVVTDPVGGRTTVESDPMGRPLTMTDPTGAITRIAYDAAGNATTVTDANGHTTTTVFDAANRPVSVTDGTGAATLTAYDVAGRPVSVTDPLGHATTTEYDAAGRPVAVTDPTGATTTTVYDAAGQVVKVTDPLGRITRYAYDGTGRVTEVARPDGTTITSAYNPTGQMVAQTNGRGHTIELVVDALGRPIAMTDEAGQDWATTYDARGMVTATTDPLGGTTTTEYDAAGRPVAVTDPTGGITKTTYDARGLAVVTTDAVGSQTTLTYDGAGRQLTMTLPSGATWTQTWDGVGNLLTSTDPTGATTSSTYDAADRPVTITDATGATTTTAYDAAGRVVATTDPVGATTATAYDAVGRPTSVTDAEGNTTTYAYDSVGNLVTRTTPRGGVTAWEYDAMDRPVQVTDAEGGVTATVYDGQGNAVTVTDPVGVVSAMTYDPRDLLTAVVENALPDTPAGPAVNVTTQYAYDDAGRLSSATDPRGNTTAYARDAAGRVTATTDAAGRVKATAYDAAGRPVTATAPDGQVTATAYTPDGQVASVAYPDHAVTFGYDAVGRRTSMKDPMGTSSWVYDPVGRVTRAQDASGAVIGYVYDAAGNQVQVSYPDARRLTREFDARGLATTQADATGTTRFSYDADGNLSVTSRPTGVVTSLTRDLNGRVTGMTHTGSGAAPGTSPAGNSSANAPGNAFGHCKDNPTGHPNQQPACTTSTLVVSYTYDPRGLVTTRTVTTDEAITTTEYAHDALGRLVSSTTGGYVATYGWDAASNLVAEVTSDDPTTPIDADGWSALRSVNAINQTTTIVTDYAHAPVPHTETVALTYDLRGNRTGQTTTTTSGGATHTQARIAYAYDAADRLVREHDAGANLNNARDDIITTWGRDGLGRALVETQNGTAQRRVFDGSLAVADGPTRITRGPAGEALVETTDTVVGHGRNATTVPVAVDVLADLLGTPLSIAEAGVVSDDLAWTGAFGNVVATPGWDTVTGYTGHLEAAGLVETPTRTYDPASRVWVQEDTWPGTATVAATQNRYTYAQGAPETLVDPTGRMAAQAAILAQRLPAEELAYVLGLMAMCRVFPAENQCRPFEDDGVPTWTQMDLDTYRSNLQAAMVGLQYGMEQGTISPDRATAVAQAMRLLKLGVPTDFMSPQEAFESLGATAAGALVAGGVFVICEAGTGGAGSYGCAFIAGAAGGATTAALGYTTSTPQYRWDGGDASLYIGTGALIGGTLSVAGRGFFGPGTSGSAAGPGTANTAPAFGSLSNAEARAWYLAQEQQIAARNAEMIAAGVPAEVRAQMAFEARNAIRSQARAAMSDREAAAALSRSDPNLTWEQVLQKYDGDFDAIAQAASRSRTSVNQQYGLGEQR
ncbi:hypothetical protein N867_11480 [Actinotalea fermentans ATCC 43279 = JCM 9966 = DSM 3133]|nr:hypothetical protein N867_11480 [Actinotalea fermentans ATCC 43279 = JCM 9966 = DSM 3133]